MVLTDAGFDCARGLFGLLEASTCRRTPCRREAPSDSPATREARLTAPATTDGAAPTPWREGERGCGRTGGNMEIER